MSAEPQPPAMIQSRVPFQLGTIIMRNKEIIGELLRLAESNNMSIKPLSATGHISHAELTPWDSLEPVTVISGRLQIEAIFGLIYPRHLNVGRHVIVTLSGIASGSCRCIRLVSHGDVEVKFHMRRVLQEQAPVLRVLPAPREHRMITIASNRDILGSLALFSQETGQIIYLRNATGTILDGTVYSYTRRELLTNLGNANILQLLGEVFPNGTVIINVTLSGVFGGTARADRLITDGDVVLDVSMIRNH